MPATAAKTAETTAAVALRAKKAGRARSDQLCLVPGGRGARVAGVLEESPAGLAQRYRARPNRQGAWLGAGASPSRDGVLPPSERPVTGKGASASGEEKRGIKEAVPASALRPAQGLSCEDRAYL